MKNRWILTKDKLPEYTLGGYVPKVVLCMTDCGTHLLLMMDYNNQKGWVYPNYKKIPHTVKVVAWMDIPEMEGEDIGR